jgi:hypothetical protein
MNYPKIVNKAPDLCKMKSRVKRHARFVNEADSEQEIQRRISCPILLAAPARYKRR